MTKDFKNLFGALILGGLLIAVTIKFWKHNIDLDLNATEQITGQVLKSGITDKTSTVVGRMKVKGNVFFINLENSSETFAIYRPEQDYKSLAHKIVPGDTVTIYYKPGSSGELNLDVYQITKGGQIIQDYETYNNNHKALIWLTGIGGLAILFSGIYPFIKKAKQNKHAANSALAKAGLTEEQSATDRL